MSAHVVVPVEPCAEAVLGNAPCRSAIKVKGCDGCLGDGTRAVLDDARPVERQTQGDPMSACGKQWRAPWIPPPDSDPIDAAYYQKHRGNERCVLPYGHEGDHRSRTNVTARNEREVIR